MSRQGFATLAAQCRGGDDELDDLIAYAALDLCDPGGLRPLTTAAYSQLPLDRTQAALDRLVLAGLISLGAVGGHATDHYVTTN